jgi:uncharacterized membrane protein YkoI
MLKTITTGLCLCAAATLGAQTPSKAPETAKKPVVQTAPATKTSTAPRKETQAELRKEAKITVAQARATALKEVPNGRVRSSELERVNGTLVYSFDIKVPGKSGIEEVQVNAVTGAVASHEHETSKMEAKEKKEGKH